MIIVSMAMGAELVRGYERYLKRQGIRSLRYYATNLRHLLDWLSCRNLALSQLTPHLINEHFCFRKSLGHGDATLRSALAGLQNFMRYALKEGLVSGDPTEGVSCRWLDVAGGFPAYQGPLRKIFRRPGVILRYRLVLFAPFWDEYLQHLLDRGYTRRHMRGVVEHLYYFHRYLTRKGVRSLVGIRPRHVGAFLHWERVRFRREHGYRQREVHRGTIRTHIERFLTYAFGRSGRHFRKPRAARRSRVLPERLLARYMDFCRAHRGLRPATRRGYRRRLLRLAPFLDRRGIRKIQDVTLADLDAFLLQQSKRMDVGGLRCMVTAVRSFL